MSQATEGSLVVTNNSVRDVITEYVLQPTMELDKLLLTHQTRAEFYYTVKLHDDTKLAHYCMKIAQALKTHLGWDFMAEVFIYAPEQGCNVCTFNIANSLKFIFNFTESRAVLLRKTKYQNVIDVAFYHTDMFMSSSLHPGFYELIWSAAINDQRNKGRILSGNLYNYLKWDNLKNVMIKSNTTYAAEAVAEWTLDLTISLSMNDVLNFSSLSTARLRARPLDPPPSFEKHQNAKRPSADVSNDGREDSEPKRPKKDAPPSPPSNEFPSDEAPGVNNVPIFDDDEILLPQLYRTNNGMYVDGEKISNFSILYIKQYVGHSNRKSRGFGNQAQARSRSNSASYVELIIAKKPRKKHDGEINDYHEERSVISLDPNTELKPAKYFEVSVPFEFMTRGNKKLERFMKELPGPAQTGGLCFDFEGKKEHWSLVVDALRNAIDDDDDSDNVAIVPDTVFGFKHPIKGNTVFVYRNDKVVDQSGRIWDHKSYGIKLDPQTHLHYDLFPVLPNKPTSTSALLDYISSAFDRAVQFFAKNYMNVFYMSSLSLVLLRYSEHASLLPMIILYGDSHCGKTACLHLIARLHGFDNSQNVMKDITEKATKQESSVFSHTVLGVDDTDHWSAKEFENMVKSRCSTSKSKNCNGTYQSQCSWVVSTNHQPPIDVLQVMRRVIVLRFRKQNKCDYDKINGLRCDEESFKENTLDVALLVPLALNINRGDKLWKSMNNYLLNYVIKLINTSALYAFYTEWILHSAFLSVLVKQNKYAFSKTSRSFFRNLIRHNRSKKSGAWVAFHRLRKIKEGKAEDDDDNGDDNAHLLEESQDVFNKQFFDCEQSFKNVFSYIHQQMHAYVNTNIIKID